MASISLPCPKCAVPPPILKAGIGASLPAGSVSFFPVNLVSDGRRFSVIKAQLKEISVDNSQNSSTVSSEKVEEDYEEEISSSQTDKPSSKEEPVYDSAIAAFMDEATRLIMLVDTTDVTELKLKNNGFELEIRKKEALPQPVPPPVTMQYPPSFPFAMSAPPALAAAPAAPQTTTPATPAAATPSLPAKSSSSSPPLKAPMAGTFYRSPAPKAPPFVKVGDKVSKGQVVCILEAMKLMNEIEADKAGTIVDIIADDGKPVPFGQPLMIIQP